MSIFDLNGCVLNAFLMRDWLGISVGSNSVSSFLLTRSCIYLGLDGSSILAITNITQQDMSSDLYIWPDFSSALSFYNISARNFPLGLIFLGFQTVFGFLSMMWWFIPCLRGGSSKFFVVGNTSGKSSKGLLWGSIILAADLMIWCMAGPGKWNMLVLAGVGSLGVVLGFFLGVLWLAVVFQGVSVILFWLGGWIVTLIVPILITALACLSAVVPNITSQSLRTAI